MRSPAGPVTSFACSRTQALGAPLDDEAELLLEADGPQETERVGLEHAGADRPDDLLVEIAAPVERVDVLAARERPRDRVDREIARREVRLDRAAKRREVDGSALGQCDAPAAVCGGEGKRCAVRVRRVCPGRALRVRARDVDVDHGPAEQLVADGAADDERLLVGEDLHRTLKHLAPPRRTGPRLLRMPMTSSYEIVPACRACSSTSSPSPIRVTVVPGSAGPGSSTANESIETVPMTRRRSPATSTSVPSQVSPEAVPVAERDEPDPCRPLRDERPAVARTLPGHQLLDLCKLAPPVEHRLEAVVRRVGAERREAVERDADPSRIQVGLRQPQRRGAVRGVQGQLRARSCLAEARELPAGEVGVGSWVGVGRGQVGHQADDVGGDRR